MNGTEAATDARVVFPRRLLIATGSILLAGLLGTWVANWNVAQWKANWNVAQWKANSKRTLDLGYLLSLGPGGWPALDEVAQDRRGLTQSAEAHRPLQTVVSQYMHAAKERDWRGYQHKRDNRLEWLSRNYPPL